MYRVVLMNTRSQFTIILIALTRTSGAVIYAEVILIKFTDASCGVGIKDKVESPRIRRNPGRGGPAYACDCRTLYSQP